MDRPLLSDPPPRAGTGLAARILSQGDEIVAGATLDTNAHWLAGELTSRGVQVRGAGSAPDDLAALERLIREACRDADLVVSTGGLGPTDDDLSAEAAARAAGRPVRESPQALEQVRRRFLSLERPMGPSNRKQALLPEGSTLLENPAGTAPGFALDIGGARAFFFPGVPHELKVMAQLHLFPWLEARGLPAPRCKRFHVCGLGESALQDRLRDLPRRPGLRVGYQTWLPYNTVVVYADPRVAGVEEALAWTSGELRARLREDLFGEDETSFPEAVGRELQERGLTLAVAESCTAGLASALLTQAAGSSAWFRGGVIAYANELKRDLLGVPEAVLERHGAVSEECARAMAAGVRLRTGADLGLATTGIAGPAGAGPGKPVGLVCFGLAGPRSSATRSVRFGDRGREQVRAVAAAHGLEWLRRRLRAGEI